MFTMALPLACGKVEENTANPKRNLTNDLEIRRVLKDHLVSIFREDPETLVLEELGLRHGLTRVDIAVVNGCLHGFEVKSDRDTLKRLPRQAKVYSEVLDLVTVVVGCRHAEEVAQKVPGWWGIQLAEQDQNGRVQLHELRKPSQNPSPDKLAIAKLLWREEALSFLEDMKAADGVRSKPRSMVYERLAEVASLDALRTRVRYQLRARIDWRSGERQTSDGG